MPYIHFTQEQKDLAARTDLEVFLWSRGEKLLPSGRDKRLSSDHSVTIRGNHWFDHATHEGGNAISFVQRFYHLGYADAVSLLLCNGQVYERPAPSSPKKFALPTANGNMRRVFAYLTQHRRIHREVVSFFAHAHLLYEDAARHNCVFVGMDENGTARHAHLRSTISQGKSFRQTAEGSDARYSFHFAGGGEALYVFELPIDLLSYITLHMVWPVAARPSRRWSRCSAPTRRSGRCISASIMTWPDTAPQNEWKAIFVRRISPPCGWCRCGRIGTRTCAWNRTSRQYETVGSYVISLLVT